MHVKSEQTLYIYVRQPEILKNETKLSLMKKLTDV